ncbi:LrgB family protein [Natroniella sp. ANB-PHB2]|uniref:LrgB family protein n=1 Tax=Natroniella sp. ANB-PHB2 TaxID=3384444 RepID=UPI0038D40757
MIQFLNTPYFGIIISILFFELGLFLKQKTKITLFNPLLVSVVAIIGVLLFFDIDVKYYNQGGEIIDFLLGPATVILAVPLYKKLELLKTNLVSILIGVTVGCTVAITSGWFLAKLFGLSDLVALSVVPKSVTTPIAMEVSEQIGGIPAITVAIVLMTGVLGAVIGPTVCKIFKIKDKVAVGVAMGSASHAVGTAKAMELGETQGAMSSLAIGVAGLITVFIAPLFMLLI